VIEFGGRPPGIWRTSPKLENFWRTDAQLFNYAKISLEFQRPSQPQIPEIFSTPPTLISPTTQQKSNITPTQASNKQ
jgi:hypothetical protein